jgi:hypothetical protein
VARVFAYANDPENFPSYWPSMIEVSNVKRTPGGGRSFDFVYKMAGFKFHGHSTSVEYVENKHVVSKAEGAIPSTFDWQYEAKDGWTQLTVDVEYTVPGALLGKLAEPIINRINDHEATAMLNNLKATLEGTK